MKPFAIISDSHNHAWSSFATTLPTGVNSRLQMILDETERAADELLALGGSRLYHAGDLFHVRGSLAPSVLNPTLDTYKRILAKGVEVVIVAGNHDLEGRAAERVSSAITALEGIGCSVINVTECNGDALLIPWMPNVAELKASIEDWVGSVSDVRELDLIIHAPIDGVIKGLPDHGLSPAYLAGLGFRRVFAGHYHHHRCMQDIPSQVWSIGALTHQTWSDVGSKAGFLLVTDKEVTWRASHAPSFVEIDGATDPDEIPLIVDGNYVKVTINSAKTGDVDAMRDYLTTCGAKGVVVLSDTGKTPTVARTGGTYKAGTTIEQSIGDFIKSKSEFKRPVELERLCGDVLTRVRSVA
jgi:DNA repair exonuclease SbcCD nuclease subunit